jgi:hypothetical protein
LGQNKTQASEGRHAPRALWLKQTILGFDLDSPPLALRADEIRARGARILLIKAGNPKILSLPLKRLVFLLAVRTDAIQRRSITERNQAMGLDMYAFTTNENVPAVDFPDPADAADLFYWRKHPNLHGWMEALYRTKGGVDDDFNVAPVRLDATDLDALEEVIKRNGLPETTGFFFGESRPEEKTRDVEFIRKAREAIAGGKRVFYTSWW